VADDLDPAGVVQQLRTWKLWTTLPAVVTLELARPAAQWAEHIDQVTLWWAGPEFDTCSAFRTSAEIDIRTLHNAFWICLHSLKSSCVCVRRLNLVASLF
jgi:hypothetical protein